jgi:hypothetical protein
MYLEFPYNGKNIITLALAIKDGNYDPPSKEKEEKYSPELKEILSSLLERVCFYSLFIYHNNLEAF